MRMGRPRKDGQKDLPPGLYLYKDRDAYIKMPGMSVPVTLDGIRDRKAALAIYWPFKQKWDEARNNQKAAELLTKLQTVAETGDNGQTVAGYAKTWRETHLPKLIKDDGEPLSDKTRGDYGRMVENQMEGHGPFKELAISAARTKHVRAFLAQWIGSPHFYNYMKSLCSRVFQQAVDEGLLEDNPAANVRRRATPKRKVVVPMVDYLAITARLEDWEARACDLIYLASHNPKDVLRLEDRPPSVRYETRRGVPCVVLSIKRSKTSEAVDIFDPIDKPGGIEETLQWFRDWKKAQNFIRAVPHFVVYPKTSHRRTIGRPVSVNYLSKRFSWAATAVDLKGKYQLRDLRKTGLNEEARKAGKATNKGAHKTQEMREHYVVDRIPQRARNNLTVLRGKG